MADLQKQPSPAAQKLMQRHALQRLPSPSRGFSAVVHVLGLASFATSFNYLINNPNQISAAYGWHFQYLTIIGLLTSTLTFTAALLADLSGNATLFRAKNLLSVCSAPLETLISTLYWGLRAIDPELVVPKELELPVPTDLGFHLAPAAFLLLDLLLLSPPWTVAFAPALALSTGIAFAYWWWIELCYTHNGFYPYPLFEMLDTTQRIGLFTLSAVLMAASTALLSYIHRKVNGTAMGSAKEIPGRVKGSQG